MIINLTKGASYNLKKLPIFTYKVPDVKEPYTQDNLPEDVAIMTQDTTSGDFCIRFLKSGILTFSKTNSATFVDISLIGGGGGGGGGYYNNGRGGNGDGGYAGANVTKNKIKLKKDIPYTITIGQGGAGGLGGYASGGGHTGETSNPSSKFAYKSEKSEEIFGEAPGGDGGGGGSPGTKGRNPSPGSHPFGNSALGTYGAGGRKGIGQSGSIYSRAGGAGENGVIAIRKYNK